MIKRAYLVIGLIFLAGCSSTPRGADILFSHSTPSSPKLVAQSIKTTPESIEVNLAAPIRVSTIVYFDTDLYHLNAMAVEKLERLTLDINGRTVRELLITGHTDSRASNAYNEKLSERRANSVVDFLKAKKLISQNTRVNWRGEMTPAASNFSSQGMALNRRTEVEVTLAQ